MADAKEVKKFIEEHVKRLKPLYEKCTLSYWNATISGKEEDYKKYEELQMELERLYNNKEEFEKVKNWKNENIEDEIVKRQIEILYSSYLSSQGDINLINNIVKKSTEIEKKFNLFRTKVSGKTLTDNDVKEVLKTELDSKKLQEIWEATKKQAEVVEKEVLELVGLRNQLARSLGFKNYYLRNLELGEQNSEEILTIFKELENLTNEPFRKLKEEIDEFLAKRYKISQNELKPWHYHDRYFQEGPKIYKIDIDKYYDKDVIEIAKKFYQAIGLNVDDILEKSDLYEKPGKYQHAYCTDINRAGDTRILENVKNNEKWMDTTLHELGHAVYNKFIDKKLPFILIDSANTFITEAIAMLFGRLSKNINFIKKYSQVKISEEESGHIKTETEKMLRLRQLVFSRWAQVMMHFERNLYDNPEQDLNKLWWSLVKKYQLINFSRDMPDWASKIHIVSAPVYYHNYLLGELLASQLHNLLSNNILKTGINNADYTEKKEIGEFLKKNVFEPGKKYRWDEMIRRATGEELTAKYFVRQFC